MATMNYLTKSRFVLAAECARKLSYELDPRYPNAMEDDDFLKALANGGHQVGALARLVYAGGTLITDRDRLIQAEQTRQLLLQADATIYEGTIIHGQLLVRCDILVKHDRTLKLIEVKSKSCNSETSFIRDGKDGAKIAGEWESYLYDLTYQAYVLGLAYPELTIVPSLLLVDKDVAAAVDGLNTAFQVSTTRRNVQVTVADTFDISVQTPSVLREFDVSREVGLLRARSIHAGGMAQAFEALIQTLCAGLDQPADPSTALPKYVSAQCKSCQFYVDPAAQTDGLRSGWHQCMSERAGQIISIARRNTVYGIYGRSKTEEFLKTEPLAIAEMSPDAFAGGAEAGETIDLARRQFLQWEEHRGETDPHILINALRQEISTWTWPLHFIDFETASPALPYTQGRRPYEQILFQFSHHVLHPDGKLVHQSQHLEDGAGVAASLPTLRKLMASLSGDQGTILHWWDHEKTILNAIRRQILEANPPDAPALLTFLETLVGPAKITGANGKPAKAATAPNSRLKDLGRLISRTAFYPGTGGSSSIKKILPAVLKSSQALRDRYSAPIYGTAAMPSLNFTDPAGFQWVVMDGVVPRDPYTLLNPLIVEDGIDASAVEDHEGADDFVANGGAAMMAYDRLQRPSLSGEDRRRLVTQLFRYCELDTLAMVIVFQSIST